MSRLFWLWFAWCVLGTASAQDYSFPTSSEDYGAFYPTAYVDHGGRDWNCGGNRYNGHRGSDFGVGGFAGMDAGRDIVAAAPGTVTRRNDGEFDRCTSGACAGGSGFGNYVYVQHANGRTTVYAHMKRGSVLPNVGDVVQCNQKIGEVGSSGASTGPHLHFQVNLSNGAASDPFDGACSGPPTYWISQGPYNGRPARACPSTGSCHPIGTLSCDQSFGAQNNGSGSRSEVASYGCSPFQNTGPEKSWTFTTPVSEPVTIAMTGLSADIDLFVTSSSACNGSNCVAGSHNGNTNNESVTFNASAGHTYTVVADGYGGAVSNFTLTASCTGGVPNYRAQVVSVSGFPAGRWTLEPGQTATGTVRLRNTGRASWSANNVRIGTTGPRDRSSPFRHSSWLGATRVRGNGGVVPRNGTVDYAVTLQAPTTPGAYVEQFGLVAEGITWFANQGGPADNMLRWEIDVVDPTPDYQAELVSVSGFPVGVWELDPGQVVTGSVTVRNTGRRTWLANNVRLASTEPRERASQMAHSSWISPSRVGEIASDVPPGDTATFTVTAQAPRSEGALVEAFGLVAEGITWFADQGGTADDLVQWDVVVAEPYRAELVSLDGLPQTGMIEAEPNDVLEGTLTLRNTGTRVWEVGALRLVPTLERGRTSALVHSTWPAPGIVASNTVSVPRGGVVSLPIRVRSPVVEGLYVEAFGLMLEPGVWFADYAGPADDLLAWDVISMPRYRAELVQTEGVPPDGTLPLDQGESAVVQITVRNTGSVTWPAEGVTLATADPRGFESPLSNATWLGLSRVQSNQTDVATGDTTTFLFALQAPFEARTVPAVFELVSEPSTWFADQGGPMGWLVDWQVVVSEDAPSLAGRVVSVDGLPAQSWNASAGETISGVVTLQNIGSSTWTNHDVRIATTGPRGRNSALRHSSWISASRIAENRTTVAPGQTVSLSVTLQAPSEPGVVSESFGLLSESAGWFADAGGPADDVMRFDVVVADADVDTEPDSDPDTQAADVDTEVDFDSESVDADSDATGSALDSPIRACGCAAVGPGPSAPLFLISVAVLVRSRRRRSVQRNKQAKRRVAA